MNEHYIHVRAVEPYYNRHHYDYWKCHFMDVSLIQGLNITVMHIYCGPRTSVLTKMYFILRLVN